jgi:hypothetical protein
MDNSKMITKTILLVVFFAALVSATEAADIHWCPGMIGFTRGQTLRMNVSNFGENAVFVIAIIHDIDGNVVQQFSSQMLDAKKTLSLDFSNGQLGPVDLRIVIDFQDPKERSTRKLISTARASIEIIDDLSRKTEVFYSPGDGIKFEPI